MIYLKEEMYNGNVKEAGYQGISLLIQYEIVQKNIEFLKQATGWRTKFHTIDCTHNTYLFLQKHLTSGTELILIGWKIVPNESL